MTKLRHLRTIVTNKNYVHEEIKTIFNSRDACYHSIKFLFRPVS
jgi:hypothetical protein